MKIRNLLLLELVFIFSAFGMEAQSLDFPMENAAWSYHCSDYPIGDNSSFSKQELVGDSLHNGIAYQNITSSGVWLTGDDSGLIRTENKKVFFIPKDSLNELLLYDFGLELGDTFYIADYHQIYGSSQMVLTQIDSILTDDGIYRKQFYFSNGGTTWIEGIGATYGSTTYPWYFFSLSGNCWMFCFLQNSTSVYRGTLPMFNQSEYDCNGLIMTLEEIEVDNLLTVFPNPFDKQISVNSSSSEPIAKLTLFDTSLRVIGSSQNSEMLMLDSKISSGIYILQINIGDFRYFKKVVRK